MNELRAMVKRGNHKSPFSFDNKSSVLKNYRKEVEQGWIIPFQLDTVFRLKNAYVAPLGVATQFTVDEHGDRKVNK